MLVDTSQTRATLLPPLTLISFSPKPIFQKKKKILLKTSERPTHATSHLPPAPGATKAKHFALQLLQKISSQCSWGAFPWPVSCSSFPQLKTHQTTFFSATLFSISTGGMPLLTSHIPVRFSATLFKSKQPRHTHNTIQKYVENSPIVSITSPPGLPSLGPEGPLCWDTLYVSEPALSPELQLGGNASPTPTKTLQTHKLLWTV